MKKSKTERIVEELLNRKPAVELARELMIVRLLAAGLLDRETGRALTYCGIMPEDTYVDAYKAFLKKPKAWQRQVRSLAGLV